MVVKLKSIEEESLRKWMQYKFEGVTTVLSVGEMKCVCPTGQCTISYQR